jgi:hypothetical protein
VPILSGGLYVPPEEPAFEDTPTPVWTEDYGNMSATWVDPDGVEWQLSDTRDESGWFTMNGPAGWGASPVEIITDPLPRGGEQVRFIRSQPRRIQWPLYVGSPGEHQEFVDRYRQIMRAFTRTTVKRQPGWLRIRRPNGRYRQIACYYEQGFEGEAGENHRFAKPVITLYCPDGYWSGDRPVTAFRQFTDTTTGSGGGTSTPVASNFFAPFFNIVSSKIVSGGGGEGGGGEGGGQTGSGTIITNPGDVAAWPKWTIRGPMSYMVAENRTVGTRFAIRFNLLDQQTITITTNRPMVRGPGDANLTSKVDWFDPLGCELWPLADGDNEVAFRVDGAGPGTRVDLDFTPRYETA